MTSDNFEESEKNVTEGGFFCYTDFERCNKRTVPLLFLRAKLLLTLNLKTMKNLVRHHHDGEYYLILFSSSEAGVSCILI